MVFDSGFRITPNRVLIPREVQDICVDVDGQVDGNEFSILLSGEWEVGRGLCISDKFFIPEQEVGIASVDYIEDLGVLRADGFNTILHSHPGNFGEFSGSDEESINTHFDCSILFLGETGEFVRAVGNIDVDDLRIQIPLDVEVVYPGRDVDISAITIQTFEFRTPYINDGLVERDYPGIYK